MLFNSTRIITAMVTMIEYTNTKESWSKKSAVGHVYKTRFKTYFSWSLFMFCLFFVTYVIENTLQRLNSC